MFGVSMIFFLLLQGRISYDVTQGVALQTNKMCNTGGGTNSVMQVVALDS
jgi:hypothetical protein